MRIRLKSFYYWTAVDCVHIDHGETNFISKRNTIRRGQILIAWFVDKPYRRPTLFLSVHGAYLITAVAAHAHHRHRSKYS